MEAEPLQRNFFIPRSWVSRLGGLDVRGLLQFKLDASLEALGRKFLPGDAAKLGNAPQRRATLPSTSPLRFHPKEQEAHPLRL